VRPVQEEHKDIRSLAIRRMNDVYRNAYQLLVLDAELQRIMVPDLRETLLRISICGWMRRLWTLLEGVVGSRAHIKFSDRIIDLKLFITSLVSTIDRMTWLVTEAESKGLWKAMLRKFYWKMALFRRNDSFFRHNTA